MSGEKTVMAKLHGVPRYLTAGRQGGIQWCPGGPAERQRGGGSRHSGENHPSTDNVWARDRCCLGAAIRLRGQWWRWFGYRGRKDRKPPCGCER